jgi:hypothetical protein
VHELKYSCAEICPIGWRGGSRNLAPIIGRNA